MDFFSFLLSANAWSPLWVNFPPQVNNNKDLCIFEINQYLKLELSWFNNYICSPSVRIWWSVDISGSWTAWWFIIMFLFCPSDKSTSLFVGISLGVFHCVRGIMSSSAGESMVRRRREHSASLKSDRSDFSSQLRYVLTVRTPKSSFPHL